jgi:hypothetical protein
LGVRRRGGMLRLEGWGTCSSRSRKGVYDLTSYIRDL